jgi:chromosome segregation protein
LAIVVTAEGTERPGGGAGTPPDRRGRGSEGDLLAERRARRAAESGEAALTRRAEAAEATMRTLEAHVASLQQRLREAEGETRRVSELLEAERASLAGERSSLAEHERRARQREYAEQQLRVEAEQRCARLERDSGAEIERLGRRAQESERDARALAGRVESVERELAEAEQAVASERAAVRGAARELHARLTALERTASEAGRGLGAERVARERAERLLEGMRRAHLRVEGLVGELRQLVGRLAAAPGGASRPTGSPATTAGLTHERLARGTDGDSGEVADALAAAAERLRARAPEHPAGLPEPAPGRPAHKHSMSLIGRWRMARKQRRER